MKTVIVISLLGFIAIGAGACGTSTSATTRINGAGSTFAYPLYSKWAVAFAKLHPDVEIDYESLGSGAGISQVTDGKIDFGGTDGPMTDKQMKEFMDQRGCAVFHIPMALGADVPAYNLPGVTMTLKFTPRALAGIFLGQITKWNHPELASANPGVSLPNAPITVVHRSDSSGTTYVWTDYLSKVSDEWRTSVGRGTSVKWPVGTDASGNQGVADAVKVTPNAIGYVELGYAIRETLLYGDVQNAGGQFIRADLRSVTAAADESGVTMPADFRVSITNPQGDRAYPISTFTWILVPERIADATKKGLLVAFLEWGLTEGQAYTESLSYARLPDAVVQKAKSVVERIH
jgi:phosphate transport system substrate-binding protein